MNSLLKYLTITLLMVASLPLSAKTYLVAVGVSDYPDTKNDLRLAAKDAKDLANLYRINNKCEVVLLTDNNATKEAVLNSMSQLFSRATSNDEVVFFFSGHGIPGSFMTYNKPLTYKSIREAMAKGDAKRKFIIADACFAGKFREDKNQKYNSREDKKADVMLFLSSRAQEKSKEILSMNNGLFTYYLIKGLKGKADYNTDRTISAKELFKYVSRHVAQDSKDAQHPVMWGRFKDNMPIFTW